MIFLLLGALALLLFLLMLRAFERAPVSTIKSLLAWIAALGGGTLVLLLVLTGRGPIAFAGLTLFGPLIWERWRASRPDQVGGGSAQPRPGSMSVEEAYKVLGLRPGASAAEVQRSYHRLMRQVHPDAGGSDWLAARINQARDVLLRDMPGAKSRQG